MMYPLFLTFLNSRFSISRRQSIIFAPLEVENIGADATYLTRSFEDKKPFWNNGSSSFTVIFANILFASSWINAKPNKVDSNTWSNDSKSDSLLTVPADTQYRRQGDLRNATYSEGSASSNLEITEYLEKTSGLSLSTGSISSTS